MADKMITTSNRDLSPLKKEGVKEVVQEDGNIALISTVKLKTITTTKVKPKTRLAGKGAKNYYPPLTTSILHRFGKTAKGKKARDRFMETEADKKRVADGVEPVIKKGKAEKP